MPPPGKRTSSIFGFCCCFVCLHFIEEMVIFLDFFNNGYRTLGFEHRQECLGREIKNCVTELQGFSAETFFLSYNGRVLDDESKLRLDQGMCVVHCHLRVLGGKGGFGSMLRAIGAQIEKTTNREACRDLSGRRMRDVNDEKKIAEWLSKQSEREQEKARQKQERLEKLVSAPRHVFEDSTAYTTQLQENMDSVDDALQKGLKSGSRSPSSSSLGKRKMAEKMSKISNKSKKQKLWLGMDEDLSSDSDDESDVGSSCSSFAGSDYLGSEASSRISSSVLGQTSDAESYGNEENPLVSYKIEKDNSPSEAEQTESIRGSTSSTSSNRHVSGGKCPGMLDKINVSHSEGQKVDKTIAVSEAESRTDACSGSVNPSSNGKECEDEVVDVKGDQSKEVVKSETVADSVTLPLDLDQYQSKEELESLGLDLLKAALIASGLKCGGTLQQRAERLFSTKGVPYDKLDPSILAKPTGKKQRQKKEK